MNGARVGPGRKSGEHAVAITTTHTKAQAAARLSIRTSVMDDVIVKRFQILIEREPRATLLA
jgi:hypothetical protein